MHPEAIRREARAMLARGCSVNRASSTLGVSRAAIRDWRDHPERRGQICPAPASSTAAYSALLGFYLGDGYICENQRAFALRIACDATMPGIIRDVETCMHLVHPERPTFHVHAPGMISVVGYWKHWPCLFPQHGPGRKHLRVLGMQPWQWVIVEEHPAAFLRGLFHSDGARVHNWATRMVRGEKKRYEYPRWQFVNASEEILGWCADALDLVGVAWRRSGRRTISVSRREDVSRLDSLIGPKE